MKQSTRKKPMTTEELFGIVCEILKEKGKMPDILDYRLATRRPVPDGRSIFLTQWSRSSAV